MYKIATAIFLVGLYGHITFAQSTEINEIKKRVSSIVEINEQIQFLQNEKEVIISGTQQVRGYYEWQYLKQNRENGILAAFGLSTSSRIEEEAKAKIIPISSTSNKPLEIAKKINSLRQTRENIFVELLSQGSMLEEIKDLKIFSHELDLHLANSEKKLIAMIYREPFPGALANYYNELNRVFKSGQRLAIFQSQVRENDEIKYKRNNENRRIDQLISSSINQVQYLKNLTTEQIRSGIFKSCGKALSY